LEGLSGSFAGKLGGSEVAKFVINQQQESLGGLGLTRLDRCKDFRGLVHAEANRCESHNQLGSLAITFAPRHHFRAVCVHRLAVMDASGSGLSRPGGNCFLAQSDPLGRPITEKRAMNLRHEAFSLDLWYASCAHEKIVARPPALRPDFGIHRPSREPGDHFRIDGR